MKLDGLLDFEMRKAIQQISEKLDRLLALLEKPKNPIENIKKKK